MDLGTGISANFVWLVKRMVRLQTANSTTAYSNSPVKEIRINRHGAKYTSQFGPGWKNYNPGPSEAEVKEMKDGVRARIRMKNGKPVAGFRYYRGLPDVLGK